MVAGRQRGRWVGVGVGQVCVGSVVVVGWGRSKAHNRRQKGKAGAGSVLGGR